MQTVQEIERAIGRLSPGEVAELQAWIDATFPQPIDSELKVDLEAGKMDSRIRRALAGHAVGSSRLL